MVSPGEDLDGAWRGVATWSPEVASGRQTFCCLVASCRQASLGDRNHIKLVCLMAWSASKGL
ncbi:hypothetical protein A2U01_0067411 [Trifolium medium]|uniref:Uncharacterized protein n=1 Tax=Trifolium medium TaxID=97028 RepID=A0A392SB95_9FABA|nr:hypothetical protein [Trifolium medium]